MFSVKFNDLVSISSLEQKEDMLSQKFIEALAEQNKDECHQARDIDYNAAAN